MTSDIFQIGGRILLLRKLTVQLKGWPLHAFTITCIHFACRHFSLLRGNIGLGHFKGVELICPKLQNIAINQWASELVFDLFNFIN